MPIPWHAAWPPERPSLLEPVFIVLVFLVPLVLVGGLALLNGRAASLEAALARARQDIS